MRQRARAKKCLCQKGIHEHVEEECKAQAIRDFRELATYLAHSIGETFPFPSRSHSCFKVLTPTVAIVNNPTHLQLTTAPRLRPVKAR